MPRATLGLVTKREQREAAEILERFAQVVAVGEVTAPSGFVGRLEGAAEALKVMSQPQDGIGDEDVHGGGSLPVRLSLQGAVITR